MSAQVLITCAAWVLLIAVAAGVVIGRKEPENERDRLASDARALRDQVEALKAENEKLKRVPQGRTAPTSKPLSLKQRTLNLSAEMHTCAATRISNRPTFPSPPTRESINAASQWEYKAGGECLDQLGVRIKQLQAELSSTKIYTEQLKLDFDLLFQYPDIGTFRIFAASLEAILGDSVKRHFDYG